MSSQKIEACEKSEIQFSRGADGSSEEGEAIRAKREESAEVKLFKNPISASTTSSNCAGAEQMLGEIGKQDTRHLHASIGAIERCASNGQPLYIHLLLSL